MCSEYDLSTVVETHVPSTRFPGKAEYNGSMTDLVFPNKILTLCGHVQYPDSFSLLKKIRAMVEVYQKYGEMPSQEKVDEIFELLLDDMMMKEEKRITMRRFPLPQKWDLIRDQQKANIQSSLVIDNCLELLRRVSVRSLIHF